MHFKNGPWRRLPAFPGNLLHSISPRIAPKFDKSGRIRMSEGIYGIYGFELDLIFRSQPLSLFRNCFKFNRAEPLECLLPHKPLRSWQIGSHASSLRPRCQHVTPLLHLGIRRCLEMWLHEQNTIGHLCMMHIDPYISMKM